MNPFYFKALPDKAPFCDREEELARLLEIARSKNDVVLYAPRRFGKTSLARRVQKALAKDGAVTLYINFFGIASVNQVAATLAASVFKVTHGKDSLWKRAMRFLTSFRPVIRPTADGNVEVSAELATTRDTGMKLLTKVLDELQEFIAGTDQLVNIVFDEFQEIVALQEADEIEAVMRTHIESYQASHFYVGSRRRLLLGIFSERQRPFFQSAHIFQLGPLPQDILVEFICNRFADAGGNCPAPAAREIARLTRCHPYYSQRLAFLTYSKAGENVTPDIVADVFGDLLISEEPVFESMIQCLPSQQRLVLQALAREATAQVAGKEYVRRHDLGSVTGINHSIKQLDKLDYIEQDKESKIWSVVDPIFSVWLAKR